MFFIARRSIANAIPAIPSKAFSQLSKKSAEGGNTAKKYKKYVAPFVVVPKSEPSDLTLLASLGAILVTYSVWAVYCFRISKLIRFDAYNFDAYKRRIPVPPYE